MRKNKWKYSVVLEKKGICVNNYTYEISQERNCKICGNTNVLPDSVCKICARISIIDNMCYDGIITFGNYYPYGRMREEFDNSTLSKHILKNKKTPYFSQLLGIALAFYLDNFCNKVLNFDCIIPVPTYRSSPEQRIHEKEKIIAQEIECVSECFLTDDLIVKTSDTKLKEEKDLQKRILLAEKLYVANQKNFHDNWDIIKGKNILVCDDLVTLNVTINQCAKILKRNFHAEKVIGIAPARTYFK